MKRMFVFDRKFANNADILFDMIESEVETLVTDMKCKVNTLEATIEALLFELEKKNLKLKLKKEKVKKLIQVIENKDQEISKLESQLNESRPASQSKNSAAEFDLQEVEISVHRMNSLEKKCDNTDAIIDTVLEKQEIIANEVKKINRIIQKIGDVKSSADLKRLHNIDQKVDLICNMMNMLQNTTWLVQNATRGKMIMKAI